ncbi:MAG: DsrE family protein [Gammaproteobacteria bacterium]|nr:DsrE family protein [Gammaproteobacteria bacterium]
MKKLYSSAVLILSMFVAPAAFADKSGGHTECSDEAKWAIDAEFGAGSGDLTRCLSKKSHVKVVYQINTKCKDATCTAPYAVGNIGNAIKDYENLHGMVRGRDYELVAVIHSAGWSLVLDDPAKNPFRNAVAGLLDKGVKVLFCQNTARSKHIGLYDMIPGIGFTTSGVTALADLQMRGYAMVQP